MTAPNVDDQPVEQFLRRALAADAEDAPPPDLPQLTDSAVHLGQAHRRRSTIAGAVVSVVVVVAGVTAIGGLGSRHQAEPPATRSTDTPTPTSTANVDPGASVLMFRGVEVPVPPAMLAPGVLHCGTPVRDAAYVSDKSLVIAQCLETKPQDELTTVVLQPIEDVPENDRDPGGRTLTDGRYQLSSALPLADVWFTVTSPDQDRARRLFDSVLVLDSVDGCPLHPGEVPVAGIGTPVISGALPDGATGRVCGYRAGWLTGATTLTPNQVGDVVALIDSAPSDGTIDCALGSPGDDGWWVTVGDQRAWVETSGCPRIVAEVGDGSARLTTSLFTTLWQLAPGPAFASDLVGSKD